VRGFLAENPRYAIENKIEISITKTISGNGFWPLFVAFCS
jgi:hypothetical protein